ncbi:hypothetical protein FRC12_013791 [Ceratobasidium sp. 428]|nr:hypothetical protein FRC12_013791 [Ceratobasidium sp. 428]
MERRLQFAKGIASAALFYKFLGGYELGVGLSSMSVLYKLAREPRPDSKTIDGFNSSVAAIAWGDFAEHATWDFYDVMSDVYKTDKDFDATLDPKLTEMFIEYGNSPEHEKNIKTVGLVYDKLLKEAENNQNEKMVADFESWLSKFGTVFQNTIDMKSRAGRILSGEEVH